MKRFVAYIYEYKAGVRLGSAGHIKVDLREEGCRLEAHVQLKERAVCAGKIFIVVKEPAPVGIPAGELIPISGQSHVLLSFPWTDLGKGEYSPADLLAFAAVWDDGRVLAAGFFGEPSEPITRGDFPVWERNPEAEPDALPEEKPAPEPEPEPLPVSYRRIGLNDLFNLPGKNRLLCKNSFLVHGFFNYHYLIIKTTLEDGEEKNFVGVPGVCEPPEERMAGQYGFLFYEEDPNGPVGYWLRPL